MKTCLARVERGHRDLRLGVGVAEEDGVHVGVEQVAVVGEAAGHVEELRGVLGGGRRDVADGGDLKLLGKLGQEGQVLHLRYGSAPNDAYAYPVHGWSPSRRPAYVLPARGATSFHRSASSAERL